ncbi:tRNA 5-methoxyuridine(34)/uridine 5-oxyacetic acid(34) synthase CmoB [bacterium]
MINYAETYKILNSTKLKSWSQKLPEQLKPIFSIEKFGDLPQWNKIYQSLPEIKPSIINLNKSCITIGNENDIDLETKKNIKNLLKKFHPWRKGPFNLFGIHIDTEWRSDWKWDRLKTHISPLKNKIVLDTGCGNGYHCFRMKGEGAKIVVGIDPYMRFVYQFYSIQKYVQDPTIAVFPIKSEQIPNNLQAFDTIFSMGLLYHRRSPMNHLIKLKSLLKPKGELILETIIIDGDDNTMLVPQQTYAKMPNVWFIPSISMAKIMLKKCGFSVIKCIDVTKTTIAEQRRTKWMKFESLENYLDPDDPNKTIEGYPAPQRAIFIAK